MTEINIPLTIGFVLIFVGLMIWLIRANQRHKNELRKMLPGIKPHRKHLKKSNLDI